MAVRAFHPILYVADPHAERDFFGRFGFETVYEGDEFPGFLAVECGSVCFGLSGNKELPPTTAYDCVRWQLIVETVDEIISVCTAAELPYEVIVEEGGTTHRSRIAKVTSPNGVVVWFEGPNELG
jgi:catechol 2,3-dioxygenase-like lactoylglutathione lyase family enzyme